MCVSTTISFNIFVELESELGAESVFDSVDKSGSDTEELSETSSSLSSRATAGDRTLTPVSEGVISSSSNSSGAGSRQLPQVNTGARNVKKMLWRQRRK